MSFLERLDDILSLEFSLNEVALVGPFTWRHTEEETVDSAPVTLTSTKRSAIPDSFSLADEGISLAGQNITGNPLGGTSWQLAPSCPVPRAIPKLNLKKGTTTLGFQFSGGVVVAVDSRASSGQYIASQTVQKVIEINDYLLGTMAGGAADCQYWERVLGMECRLWELRNGSRITVASASKILANITYSYRNHGLSMGTMVGGWDKFGPALYYVDDHGTRIKHNLFSVGSGSIYAYGVLDEGYKFQMTPAEATELARKAIFHATYRDGGSGGLISVYHIHQKGWTKVSKDDQTSLFSRYIKH